jgi:hypothetical protein
VVPHQHSQAGEGRGAQTKGRQHPRADRGGEGRHASRRHHRGVCRRESRAADEERGLDLDLSTINGDLSRMNGAEFDTFMKSLDDMNIEIDDGTSQARITAE